MPIYEYECPDCGAKFERIGTYSDRMQQDCPACDSERAVKVPSATAIQFRGSGFYQTDYKARPRTSKS